MRLKRLRNNDGYALLLTVFVIILFGVLAVSLMSVVISGSQKNVIRENVTQASELSEKGIEHITNQIQSELEGIIPEQGIGRGDFLTELNNTLNKYLCTQVDGSLTNFDRENRTGDYEVCIESIEDIDGDELRKKVTFLSTGIVDGKEQLLRTTTLIGASDVPDALNYAIGSHRTCTGNDCLDGEGNLFLHGGITVQGDIKVDGNLITTNRGHAIISSKHYWINSLYPEAIPGEKASNSRLVLGGDVYTFSNNPTYSTHISSTTFPSKDYKKVTNLAEAFETPPILVSRDPKREKIEINSQANNFKYNFNESDVKLKTNNDRVISNRTFSNQKVFPYYETQKTYQCGGSFFNPKYCTEYTQHTNGTYTIRGNNVFGQFATDGNVSFRSSTSSFSTTTFEKGMYVHGNLNIGNTGISDTSYNPKNYEKVRISGPIYVNGDLTIKGADVEFNALIYVNGKVTIRNSRINGIIQNGKQGSLIVFANGNIQIANNSVNLDEPSNIRGFFYSEDALEMYGVGSNIRIDGGISAKRIVLNAIRGRASSRSFTGAQRITNNDYFEGVSGQRNRSSRLQIIYNPEIITTYSDLKSQEPVIYNIDPPELIDRE